MPQVVTVAICTYNRSRSLSRTLDSLKTLTVPPELDWEVLVVDNCCTDDTADVISLYSPELPLQPLREPRQGLSHARNLALENARGDYILWTDDDVVVEREWLRAYLDAFWLWPEAVVFGGPVDLELEGCPPLWLLDLLEEDEFAGVYAYRNLGDQPIRFDVQTHRVPYGANMATRTHEQRRYRFDPRLGRSADGHIRGEETAFISSVLADGFDGRWVPGARVSHCIPASLQTLAHLRRYFIGSGRTHARLSPRRRIDGPRSLAIAAYFELRFRLARFLLRPPQQAFRELRKAWFHFGKFLEALH